MRRLSGPHHRGDRVRAGAPVSSRSGASFVAVRPHRRAAVGRDCVRRMAVGVVLLGGRPRPRPQYSAIHDWRSRRGDRRLPAGQRRAAAGDAARRPGALDPSSGRRRADPDGRPWTPDHHDPVDRLAAADDERHPDDRDQNPVRDGAGRIVVAARRIRHDRRHASSGHAHDDGGGARTGRDRHLPATGGGRRLLPRGELRGLLPGADRLASPGTELRTAVSSVGLPVVCWYWCSSAQRYSWPVLPSAIPSTRLAPCF